MAALIALDRPMFQVMLALYEYGVLTTRGVLLAARTGWEEGHRALNRAAGRKLVKRYDGVHNGHHVIFNKLTELGEAALEAVLEAYELHIGMRPYSRVAGEVWGHVPVTTE